MHVEDIKAGLRKRGVTLATLAAKLKVTPGTVSIVIKERRSARIESAIADALGVKPEKIWPQRYAKRGKG